jgi:hypothetical protein
MNYLGQMTAAQGTLSRSVSLSGIFLGKMVGWMIKGSGQGCTTAKSFVSKSEIATGMT